MGPDRESKEDRTPTEYGTRATGGPMARSLWIASGFISLGLGILGILLPLLPGTPFLLLSAYCFERGSPRFHRWLLENRVFGGYIRDYQDGLGIPMNTKIVAVTALWAMILLTGFVLLSDLGTPIGTIPSPHLRGTLIIIAIIVSIHILSLPTLDRKR